MMQNLCAGVGQQLIPGIFHQLRIHRPVHLAPPALAKLAHGLADYPVSTLALATRAPILVAPAMNSRMWAHARTKANAKQLQEDGVSFVGPATGYLSEGQSGLGRMADVGEILLALRTHLEGT